MTEKYFFVDYENVHQAGMKGIEKLTENDKVIIFYTPTNETLTFSMYKKMIRSEAGIELYRVQNGGKDAINFQICTFIGYIIGNSPESECYIISNDSGYEYIINFWKGRNADIIMSPNILKILQQEIVESSHNDNTFDKILKLLDFSEEDRLLLCDIIEKGKKMYSTSDCLYIKGEITRKFSIDVYNSIKPYI
ncbi:MAG: hypothetical protein K2J39_01240 [Ruminococcus sp.]|nr:hypothetical protein [Ruminococcus sp.]